MIFTRPEVAAVGAGAGGISGKRGVTTRTIRHSDVDRAIIDRRTDGFTRLFLDRSGRIVGGVIVGPRAGESLAEVVLAIRHRMRAGDIGAAMHAHPTYGGGVWKAAIAEGRARLQQPMTRRGIALIARARRLLRR